MDQPDAPAASSPRIVGVILGAGQGSRMGAAQNKIFLPLAGKPLLAYAIATFDQAPAMDELLLVAHPQEVAYMADTVLPPLHARKPISVIPGGATRHQSEDRALDALRSRIASGAIDMILIHDGARPFVTQADIAQLIQAAQSIGGALLATPVPPQERIVVSGSDGSIQEELPADKLFRAQTPQAFAAQQLLAAYDRARAEGYEGTDTAASFARAGYPVQVVPCAGTNIKVTTPEDLALAEYLRRQAPGA